MRYRIGAMILSATLVGISMAHNAIADSMSWQEQRLLKPTGEQRAAEHQGQVMIYDRLDEKVVNQALDAHFSRIQNMMFIRVQHQAKDGTVVEDDDC